METLNSRLLSYLFDLEKLGEGACLRVLDLGPANTNTLKFLSQFNCRLHIADIRAKLIRLNEMRKEDPEGEPGEIRAYIEDAFHFPDNEYFDVCLMWDFINYLDVDTLSIFSEVLLPHLAQGARLHGFTTLNKNMPLKVQNYGVIDNETLSVSDQRKTDVPYRQSQSAIKYAMKGVSVKQSVLRSDGRLEMILSSD